jgi:RNA polymerase sigma-70 factor (ECF subfamily)
MDYAAQTAGTLPYGLCPTVGSGAQRRNLGSENPQIQWVRQAQAGDLQAFERLFEQYQRGIYNLVYQMVRSESDAADLTQDVFIRAWKSLPRLEAPEAFTSWIYRIAANLSRNWIRDNTRVRVDSLDQPYGNEEDEGSGREVADFSGDPSSVTQTRAMQETVQRAIEGLSPDHRTVVMLHHIEGMPVEEIAQIMKCSVGTVKSRLSRARDHLRRKLAGFVEG